MAAHGKLIIAIWHESMALGAYYFRKAGFCTLTSHSFDGELATRIVEGFGHTAVRGSSSRGGSTALRGLSDTLGQGQTVGVTLDGPRGPRHQAKPGVSILSARTQAHVIPIAFGVHPGRRLNSWDRFPLPWPFARVTVLFGAALTPPTDDGAESVEASRQEAESALNRLHSRL